MPYLFIENFEAGLDSRKTWFTAPPGSLRRLVNGHINRGKEIEKRRAFVSLGGDLTGTFGLHVAVGQPYVFGSAAAPSLPYPLRHQQLTSPNGGNMVKLWAAENFNGGIYAIAEYDDGSIHHFYRGVLVSDWETLSGNNSDENSVARALARRLQEDPNFIRVDVVDDIIYTTGVPGIGIPMTVPAGSMTNYLEQPHASATPETRADAEFLVTGGSTGPTFNMVGPVTVDGVDIMGGSVNYDTDDDTTAAAVAARINGYPGTAHTATSILSRVRIFAPPGLGASANGQVLSVSTSGDVTVSHVHDMENGADPTEDAPQVNRIEIDAFVATDQYTLRVDGTDYFVQGQYTYMPLFARTFKDKMWAGAGAQLFFSGFADSLPDCTKWINDETGPPVVVGAGFLNISTQDRGAEEVVAVGVYQDRIAVYSRQNTQIWNVDPDPDQNSLYQTLYNVGAVSAESVVEYGDLDLFALDSSGVRSLRARDSSNLASSDDVGVAIDGELVDHMRAVGPSAVASAAGILEPREGRYFLSVGDRVYVFSNFPGSRVSAWSSYDLGGVVSAWASSSDRLYARIGDDIQVLGGLTGDVYDDTEVVAELPFMDSSSPGDTKQYSQVDLGVVGSWSAEIATEPALPDEWETVAKVNQTTYGSQQKAGLQARGTHIAMRFKTTSAERAILGNVLIHYEEASRP